MGRVRTLEEVEEIKVREKIKFSLVRQQIDLNREVSQHGCPTARGKIYITSIFQKDGKLALDRPQLALECVIRAHLNQKDVRRGHRPIFESKLHETEVRDLCHSKDFKLKCAAYRRFVEEAASPNVKRGEAQLSPIEGAHSEGRRNERLLQSDAERRSAAAAHPAPPPHVEAPAPPAPHAEGDLQSEVMPPPAK